MFYLGKAPPLRTGTGKGGSGRGEKEGKGGREGVGPRRRGSAAAWVRGGLDNSEGLPYLPILTDDDAEWLYRLPLASTTKYRKFSRKSLFTASRFFIWVRHISNIRNRHVRSKVILHVTLPLS